MGLVCFLWPLGVPGLRWWACWPQPLPFRQQGTDVKKSHDGRCKEESTPVSFLLAVKKAPSTLSVVSRKTLAGLSAPRDGWRVMQGADADAVFLLNCSQLPVCCTGGKERMGTGWDFRNKMSQYCQSLRRNHQRQPKDHAAHFITVGEEAEGCVRCLSINSVLGFPLH